MGVTIKVGRVSEEPGASERARRSERTSHLVWGLVLMAVGATIFLSRADLIEIGPLWKLWPTALIAIGVADLFHTGTAPASADGGVPAVARPKIASGVTMLLLGMFFLATNYEFMGLTLRSGWPLVLVAVGTGQVVRALVAGERHE